MQNLLVNDANRILVGSDSVCGVIRNFLALNKFYVVVGVRHVCLVRRSMGLRTSRNVSRIRHLRGESESQRT